MQQKSAGKSIEMQKEYLGKATDYIQPWIRAGGSAVGQLGGLYGLPGYTALDPTATLTATPGYQFLVNQALGDKGYTGALGRYAASVGMNASGPAMKSAVDYGEKLAQTYAWNPYISGLQQLSGQGLQAGTSAGGWTMNAGKGMGDDYMAGEAAAAAAHVQAANAQQAAERNKWNNIIKGVGMVGSMIAAPMTGGTSLLGMGMSGLGSVLGGASSMLAPGMNAGGMTGASYMGMGKAAGGPVSRNNIHVVGERGPEVFVPTRDGYIIPNHLLRYSAFNA
jgi:hypothetical protein